MTTERARVHLRVLDEDRTFEVPLVVGQTTLVETLPALWSLIGQATDAAAEKLGPATCQAGCGACCRHLVMLSVADARALHDAVLAMPEERRAILRLRFADGVRRMEGAGLLGPKGKRAFVLQKDGTDDERRGEVTKRYFALGLPCPFLEDEACSIHPVRPLICREYLVTSDPQHCATYGHEKIVMYPLLGVAAAMALAAKEVAGTSHEGLPMFLLFEWMEQEGAKLDAKVDGIAVFQSFIEKMSG